MSKNDYYENLISQYNSMYYRFNNRNYVINQNEIQDLISYSACKIAQNYISSLLSSKELQGDSELLELVHFDLNNFITSYVNSMYFGFVVYELVYDKIDLGIKELVEIPYTLINKQNTVLEKDEPLTLNNKIILEPLKYEWLTVNNPKPYGTTMMTCDLAKTITHALKIKTHREFYLYRLANPLYVANVENTHSERFMQAFKGIKKGLTGLILGKDESVTPVSEINSNGELLNKTIAMLDNEIYLHHGLTANLIKSNESTGSYAQSATELELLYNNLNKHISNINIFLSDLSNKLIELHGFANDIIKLHLPVFEQINYKEMFDIVNATVDKTVNQEEVNELLSTYISNVLSKEIEFKVNTNTNDESNTNVDSEDKTDELDNPEEENNNDEAKQN